MRFLWINDNAQLLSSLQMAFTDFPTVEFAECHSTKDAFSALSLLRPEVVFLDHQLSPDGNEGLEIVDRARAPLSNL